MKPATFLNQPDYVYFLCKMIEEEIRSRDEMQANFYAKLKLSVFHRVAGNFFFQLRVFIEMLFLDTKVFKNLDDSIVIRQS